MHIPFRFISGNNLIAWKGRPRCLYLTKTLENFIQWHAVIHICLVLRNITYSFLLLFRILLQVLLLRSAWNMFVNWFKTIISVTCTYKNSFLNLSFCTSFYNPLTPTAIQKLLEIIDRVRLYPSCLFATALDSDINQTTGSGGHLSMWKSMYACRSVSVACRPAEKRRRRGEIGSIRR